MVNLKKWSFCNFYCCWDSLQGA